VAERLAGTANAMRRFDFADAMRLVPPSLVLLVVLTLGASTVTALALLELGRETAALERQDQAIVQQIVPLLQFMGVTRTFPIPGSTITHSREQSWRNAKVLLDHRDWVRRRFRSTRVDLDEVLDALAHRYPEPPLPDRSALNHDLAQLETMKREEASGSMKPGWHVLHLWFCGHNKVIKGIHGLETLNYAYSLETGHYGYLIQYLQCSDLPLLELCSRHVQARQVLPDDGEDVHGYLPQIHPLSLWETTYRSTDTTEFLDRMEEVKKRIDADRKGLADVRARRAESWALLHYLASLVRGVPSARLGRPQCLGPRPGTAEGVTPEELNNAVN